MQEAYALSYKMPGACQIMFVVKLEKIVCKVLIQFSSMKAGLKLQLSSVLRYSLVDTLDLDGFMKLDLYSTIGSILYPLAGKCSKDTRRKRKATKTNAS